MINQVLDKLGIYDLVVVLLSGMCITMFSGLLAPVLIQADGVMTPEVGDTVPFLLISYFVGVIFQEIGSLLQKRVIQRDDKLLKSVFKSGKHPDYSTALTSEEQVGIRHIVRKKMKIDKKEPEGSESDIQTIYNYCRLNLNSADNMARADRNQSISGMSRSLSLYFFGIFLVTGLTCLCNQSAKYLCCAIAASLLSILLYFRCIRFAKMRYVYIIRTYYYNFYFKKNNQSNSKVE